MLNIINSLHNKNTADRNCRLGIEKYFTGKPENKEQTIWLSGND
jgi:hypothetical protein